MMHCARLHEIKKIDISADTDAISMITDAHERNDSRYTDYYGLQNARIISYHDAIITVSLS